MKFMARAGSMAANDCEQYSRRQNIRIRGINIPEDANAMEFVAAWINTNLDRPNIPPDDIAATHQLFTGKSNSTHESNASPASTVLVRFHRKDVRDSVISGRKVLKKSGDRFQTISPASMRNFSNGFRTATACLVLGPGRARSSRSYPIRNPWLQGHTRRSMNSSVRWTTRESRSCIKQVNNCYYYIVYPCIYITCFLIFIYRWICILSIPLCRFCTLPQYTE